MNSIPLDLQRAYPRYDIHTSVFAVKRMKQLPGWFRCTGVLLQVKLSSNDGFPTFIIRHSCRLFIWSCNNCWWLPSRVTKNNHIQHLISENVAGLYSKVGVAILPRYDGTADEERTAVQKRLLVCN